MIYTMRIQVQEELPPNAVAYGQSSSYIRQVLEVELEPEEFKRVMAAVFKEFVDGKI